jgi:transposase
MKIEHIDINKTLEDARVLLAVENPDEITVIPIDKRTLPKGKYRDAGYDARQVMDIRISRFVIENRAQILEDQNGNQFVAPFPAYVTRPVQYGQDLKAHSVYLSQFQLLPYNRIDDYFSKEIEVSVSSGSIFNFNNVFMLFVMRIT